MTKKSVALTAAGVASMLLATVAIGQHRPTPDQMAVGFRQALMTVIGGTAVPMALMQSGRIPYDAALIRKNAANLPTLAGMIPDAFARNTSHAAGVRTSALAAIWEKHDEFLTRARDLRTQVDKLATVVKGGDEDQIKAAIKDVNEACGACHKDFRKRERM